MPAVLEAVHKTVAGHHLTAGEAQAALTEILSGGVSPALVAALLVALRVKGEAAEEIVGFARALREKAVRVECGDDRRPLVDTCGTGGGAPTFNISTATAFVVAGAGARVAKHGNRSMTSCCGSADVLEELGANLNLEPRQIARCVQEVGIGFMFAPAHHPAMRHVQPIRAELKMRTVFNLLGPLANPAGATVQIVGVAEPRLVLLIGEVLAQLGIERGLVVHGADGLDEISTTGPTMTAEIHQGRVRQHTLNPSDFGIERARLDQLAGGDRRQNAACVRAVLSGGKGAPRDIVLVNAAATLRAAGLACDLAACMALARDSIDTGRALQILDRFIDFARSAAVSSPAAV